MNAKISGVDELVKEKYEAMLDRVIASSQALHTSNVNDCLLGNGLGFYIPETNGSVFYWQ